METEEFQHWTIECLGYPLMPWGLLAAFTQTEQSPINEPWVTLDSVPFVDLHTHWMSITARRFVCLVL